MKHSIIVCFLNDRVRVTWVDVFNDGPQCTEVDFLIMIQPKADPSTYTLSDFTRKGQRTATLKLVDPTADYIFQVLVPWPLVGIC